MVGDGALALEPNDPYYVEILEKAPEKDPILQLMTRIDWADSESINLLTGFRGNGKSTALRRLKGLLEAAGCQVILVDMLKYVLMTKPLETSDFILSLMVALSEEVQAQTGLDFIHESYWTTLANFLQSEVKVDLKAEWKSMPATLALKLKSEPSFKQELQTALRGHLGALIENARNYVKALVDGIRKETQDPNKKVVLLVDSLEQLRGIGVESTEIHNSVASVFCAQADKLRFRMLHVVYTVPPYLITLAPNIARSLGENSVIRWPNIHVRNKQGEPDDDGLSVMTDIIKQRYADWQSILTPAQLKRLAMVSGGDLRDFFRLIKDALVSTSHRPEPNTPITDDTLTQVEGQLRSELLPIPKDDAQWLAEVHQSKSEQLGSITEVARLMRFLDGNLIMNYLNGEPWCDIHPLLIKEILNA